jgi:pyruvate,orthophosphate dikinase
MEAACQLAKEGGKVVPEIMIPLVGDVRELRDQKAVVVRVAEQVMKDQKIKVKYLVGTMIEVPRGAITADEVATEADFFSFGTNDLTQLTYGFSRDDIGKFLGAYQDRKILDRDPFASLDVTGVGQLVAMGTKKGRATKPKLKVGDFDYVSCSPFRVPVARLAAAQSALKKRALD